MKLRKESTAAYVRNYLDDIGVSYEVSVNSTSHIRFDVWAPDGRKLILSTSAHPGSEFRSWLNYRAKIKRFMRGQ